mmetsp:Transcript_82537/g.228974  ORF Transcript_82537/g.228974 Transcript_82537/m.228974 type:complete len:303 (-) Transcript_82537:248-1156(-)
MGSPSAARWEPPQWAGGPPPAPRSALARVALRPALRALDRARQLEELREPRPQQPESLQPPWGQKRCPQWPQGLSRRSSVCRTLWQRLPTALAAALPPRPPRATQELQRKLLRKLQQEVEQPPPPQTGPAAATSRPRHLDWGCGWVAGRRRRCCRRWHGPHQSRPCCTLAASREWPPQLAALVIATLSLPPAARCWCCRRWAARRRQQVVLWQAGRCLQQRMPPLGQHLRHGAPRAPASAAPMTWAAPRAPKPGTRRRGRGAPQSNGHPSATRGAHQCRPIAPLASPEPPSSWPRSAVCSRA